MRGAIVLLASTALASCSLVLGIEDRSVGTTDFPAPNPDAGDAEAAKDATDEASATADAGAFLQLPIGTGCAGRVPPWLGCLDFEDGETGSLTLFGGGTATVVVSGADKVLRATVPSAGGVAHRPINVSEGAKRVVWSFDVRIDASVTDNTEVGSLDMPIAGADYCSVQINRRAGRLLVLEYCRIASAGTSTEITDLVLPPVADDWFNVLVDTNLTERKVSASLRWPGGSTTKQGSGVLSSRPAVGAKATIDVGIAFAPTLSVVEIDNVVTWWSN